jgi:hypothetical protein
MLVVSGGPSSASARYMVMASTASGEFTVGVQSVPGSANQSAP